MASEGSLKEPEEEEWGGEEGAFGETMRPCSAEEAPLPDPASRLSMDEEEEAGSSE